MRGDDLHAFSRGSFRTPGRGVVVTFDDQNDVRYSTIEDLRGALAKAPELAGLIDVTGQAVASYDPEREAVVLESGPDADKNAYFSCHITRTPPDRTWPMA